MSTISAYLLEIIHPFLIADRTCVKKGGNSWGVVYNDTTANQAYLMDSLSTHLLQDHVEVLTAAR